MKAFYESIWAQLPDEDAGQPWQWHRRRELLRAAVRPGMRVLDLGCGSGHFAAAATGFGAAVTAVDISELAVERARRRAPAAHFGVVEEDGTLPLAHGTVDLVWCSEVIEHVVDVATLLLETRRVLAPGGRLLLTTPAHGRLRRVVIALGHFDAHFDPLGQHLRFFTRRSLSGALAAGGFDQIRIDACGGSPLLRSTLVAQARRPGLTPA